VLYTSDVNEYRWLPCSRTDYITKQVIYLLHVQVQHNKRTKYHVLYPAIEFPTAVERDDYMRLIRADVYAQFAELFNSRGVPHFPHPGRKVRIQ
jgi:hypothetical protein